MRGVFAIVGLVTRLCDGVSVKPGNKTMRVIMGLGTRLRGVCIIMGARNKTMRGVSVVMGLGIRL